MSTGVDWSHPFDGWAELLKRTTAVVVAAAAVPARPYVKKEIHTSNCTFSVYRLYGVTESTPVLPRAIPIHSGPALLTQQPMYVRTYAPILLAVRGLPNAAANNLIPCAFVFPLYFNHFLLSSSTRRKFFSPSNHLLDKPWSQVSSPPSPPPRANHFSYRRMYRLAHQL